LTLFQSGHVAVVRRIETCPANHLAVSVISVEEQLTGWYTKLRRAKTRIELARAYDRLALAVGFLSQLRIFAFPETAISRYELLRAAHRNIRKNDLRICRNRLGEFRDTRHEKHSGF